MSTEEELKKVQEVANKYEAVFRSLPGVVSVYVVDGGFGISLTTVDIESRQFLRALLADRIEGVPVTVGYGGSEPSKKKC